MLWPAEQVLRSQEMEPLVRRHDNLKETQDLKAADSKEILDPKDCRSFKYRIMAACISLV
jgi:hypothetical protein